jgi:hypothetical protein
VLVTAAMAPAGAGCSLARASIARDILFQLCVCMATGRRAPDNPVAAGAGLDIQRRWPLLVEVDIPTEQSRD